MDDELAARQQALDEDGEDFAHKAALRLLDRTNWRQFNKEGTFGGRNDFDGPRAMRYIADIVHAVLHGTDAEGDRLEETNRQLYVKISVDLSMDQRKGTPYQQISDALLDGLGSAFEEHEESVPNQQPNGTFVVYSDLQSWEETITVLEFWGVRVVGEQAVIGSMDITQLAMRYTNAP